MLFWAVALPEYFMVDGTIHPDHADRLSQTVSLFDKVCVIAGLGGEGIFWQAVVDNMRAWAGIYSNLEGIALRRKCAPVLLIGISTHRPDLEKRWIINLLVTKRMNPEEAREKILFYAGLLKDKEGNTVKTVRVALQAVQHAQGYGVRIETLHPHLWLIHEWEELAPALAAAGRSVGTSGLLLPCNVSVPVSKNFWGKMQYQSVSRELPVESIPLLKTLAKAVGKETLDEAFDDVGLWALTMPEKVIVALYRQLTFDNAFQGITDGFKPAARDYMYGRLFEFKITPPSSMTYDAPQTVLAWAQPDVTVEQFADMVLGEMFAEVDRTAEFAAEDEREQRLDRQRRKAVQATRKNRLLRE